MAGRPSLSIVIPTLNEQANIAAAVAHAWRLEPVEVIVCDGRSTDDTRVIAEAGRATVVASDPGRGVQLNAGAELAMGDMLLFLHADTWLAAEARQQIDAAMQDPSVVWGAFRQKIDAPGWRYRSLEWGNALRAKRFGMPYGDQAIFVKKEIFAAQGGYAEHPVMEDVDLSRRLQKIAPPAFLPGPLHISARRWRHAGVVRQTVRNWAFIALWRLGVSPERLARWYQPHGNQTDDPPLPMPAHPASAGKPVNAGK